MAPRFSFAALINTCTSGSARTTASVTVAASGDDCASGGDGAGVAAVMDISSIVLTCSLGPIGSSALVDGAERRISHGILRPLWGRWEGTRTRGDGEGTWGNMADLDAERIQIEAIGQPGERRFRLLALVNGQTYAVWMEKQQVQALGLALEQMLERLPDAGPD